MWRILLLGCASQVLFRIWPAFPWRTARHVCQGVQANESLCGVEDLVIAPYMQAHSINSGGFA
jgi:hypothetical protein